MKNSPKNCQICHQTAHGQHFGVDSCRACAAFFRRSVVSGKSYACRLSRKNCQIPGNSKSICRFCRFQKCLQLGMTPDNVLYNYDTPIRNDKKNKYKEIVLDVSYEFQLDEQGDQKLKLDISGLLQNIESVFKKFSLPANLEHLNSLKKMEDGLLAYRKTHKKHVKFVSEVKMNDYLIYSNTQIKEIARFLSYSDHFRQLSIKDRMRMLKTIWVQWKRLERFEWTARLFGNRMYEENLVTLLPGIVGNMNSVDVDCSKIIYKNLRGMKSHVESFNNSMMRDVGKPMIDLQLSTIELTFMLSFISWHVAGKELQGTVLAASETALEEHANDLHFYYINEKKMPNYSYRLIKIMKVLHSCQKHHTTRQNFMDLIRIFDYFRVDVSDKELYKAYF